MKKSLPQSAYGQGQVVASPFQMARVAATVANGGTMPQGRWITDETNTRTDRAASRCCRPTQRRRWRTFMREVVTSGTGRRAAGSRAHGGQDRHRGTGGRASHAWFIGFAPVRRGAPARSPSRCWWRMECTAAPPRRPPAAEIVNAAAKLGLIQP